MKFESERAEQFYGIDPDDQAGSSSEGIGWVGLFVSDRVVLRESTDGFVDIFEYETEEEMRLAWRNFTRTYELRMPDLSEEPVIFHIKADPPLFIYTWKDEFSIELDRDTAVNHVRERMGEVTTDFWEHVDDGFYLTRMSPPD